MLFDAVEDFMSRYPNVKSQAGGKKTTPLKIEDLGARPLAEEGRKRKCMRGSLRCRRWSVEM
jgi:hypothetical protein